MLVLRDLGLRAAGAVILTFIITGLFVRRKWRLSVARAHEINRLIVLAAEEAALAELEATSSFINYDTTTDLKNIPVTTTNISPAAAAADILLVGPQRFCPACYSPASLRCARCKGVYYCSGKCQIVHWRQGHKDECHPPHAGFEDSEEGTNFAGDALNYSDGYVAYTGNYPVHYSEDVSAQEELGFSDLAGFPTECSTKDEKGAHLSSYGKESDATYGLHEISVQSGVPASSVGDGTCIGVSVSDEDSLCDVDSNSGDACSVVDHLEIASSVGEVEESKPLEEDSHSRVQYNSNILSSGVPDQDTLVKSINPSASSRIRCDKNSVEPSISPSDFWDGALEYCISRKNAQSNIAKPESGGSGEEEFSDPKFSPEFSSNVSESGLSKSHKKDSEPSGGVSPGISSSELVMEPVLLDSVSTKAPRLSSSRTLSSNSSEIRVKGTGIDSLTMKSAQPASGTSKDRDVLSSSSGRGNDSINGDTKDSLLSTPSQNFGLSQKSTSHSSSSSTKEPIAQPANSAKAGSTALAPQVASTTPSAAIGLKTSMLKVMEQLRAPKSSKQNDVGKNNDKAIFPYELFVKLYHWNKVELLPCGLVNCGNSCFANVVLQCLAFTPPITAYLLQGLHSRSCAKKDWCFMCEFERLILKTKEGGTPISPIAILSQIQKIGSNLANGREEDAHEFLRYAIDSMQSICLKEAGVSASSSLEEETTLLGLTFGGYLRSKIKCSRCHGKSERQERIMDLTVEIQGDIDSLEDALKKFTGTEILDGENKYHCSRCKSYEKAKKKLSILEAPNILTIALKRFQSGKFGKINKSIRFPEILNLAPYMRGANDKSPIYRLYGVVVHLDIMNAAFSGHYISYVRNAQNKWYKTDDSKVKPVELERVLNKGAYMLFYSRVSPRAPRSIRSSIVYRDLPSKIRSSVSDPSRSSGRNYIPDGLPNLGHVHQNDTRHRGIPPILEVDSSSDSSSLFSHSDEASTSTDSTRESFSADDISDYIFGSYGYNPWRYSSDSDTSSSSSSSSSPLYTKRSPLSNSERYASAVPELSGSQADRAHSVLLGNLSRKFHEDCRAEDLASGGVPFLQSNCSKQARKLVNSSSCRDIDSQRLRPNPFDNVKSGVHLRRSPRKKAD